MGANFNRKNILIDGLRVFLYYFGKCRVKELTIDVI